MNKKLIITGINGFIGKNLLPFLNDFDLEIFMLDQNDNFTSQNRNIKFFKCNLHDHNEVSRILKSVKASHLLHMAWYVTPPKYYESPVNFDWLKSSMILLEEFQKNQGERAIMIGSCWEYDWNYGYLTEDLTPTSFNNLYAFSKNSLRRYADAFCNYFGLEIAWPRLFFLFGTHEHPQRLIPQIITSLLQGKSATILNGEIYRDYLYVKECAGIISKLIFNNYTGTINIGSGIPTKLGDLGKLTADIIGRPDLLKIESPRNIENRVIFANTKKLNEDLAFTTSNNLREGLEETVKWWKENI